MVFPITKRIVPLIFKPFLGECTGLENIPKKGGAILAANHASYLDHFIVGGNLVSKLDRHARFLAKKEHFETPIQNIWHRYLRAIPVDRKAGGKEALKKAIEELNKGSLIMIYPEGTRTLTGKMQRAKTGVARLALEAKVPVVPIGITNSFEIWPKWKKLPKKGKKADLHIGSPLHFNHYYSGKEDRKILRKVTTMIMKEIAKLADKEYRFDEEYL